MAGRRSDFGSGAPTPEAYAFSEESLARALEYAGLGWSDLRPGPHPDSGSICLFLAADIQQYSAFLACLAMQHRAADDLAVLTGQVRLQYDGNGDTRFWFPNMSIRTT